MERAVRWWIFWVSYLCTFSLSVDGWFWCWVVLLAGSLMFWSLLGEASDFSCSRGSILQSMRMVWIVQSNSKDASWWKRRFTDEFVGLLSVVSWFQFSWRRDLNAQLILQWILWTLFLFVHSLVPRRIFFRFRQMCWREGHFGGEVFEFPERVIATINLDFSIYRFQE